MPFAVVTTSTSGLFETLQNLADPAGQVNPGSNKHNQRTNRCPKRDLHQNSGIGFPGGGLNNVFGKLSLWRQGFATVLPDTFNSGSRTFHETVEFGLLLLRVLPFKAQGEAKRSEERRVGKECRSRWSPDH